MEGKKMTNYEKLAEQIASAIEQQQAPWQKPWKPGIPYIPFNPTTGKQYQGINTLILLNTDYIDPRWMTFKQAQKEGYSIKKGAKAHNIIYWKTTEIEENINEHGEIEQVEVLLEKPRAYWSQVFNAADIEGIPPLQESQNFEWKPIEKADELLHKSGAIIKHDSNNAYYKPSIDEIHLPPKENFESAIGYYQTALHELGHWTGHPDRLNRPINNKYGTPAYAKEELIAEITSVMTGGYTGLGYEPKKQNLSYIQSWAQKIRKDPSIILQAAAEADKATKYIIGHLKQEHTLAVERNKENIKNNDMKEDKRIYILVPIKEKEEAKKLGAKWDKNLTSWYIPEGVNKTLFNKWKINRDIMKIPKAIDIIFNIESKVTDEIKETLEKENKSFLTKQYINFTTSYADFNNELYKKTGNHIEDYGIKYDGAHDQYYLIDNAKYTIKDLPDGMEKDIEKTTGKLEKYYLNYFINSLSNKLGNEKTTELGLKYDEEKDLYYCKPEERYKFLPWLEIYQEVPEKERYYLEVTGQEEDEFYHYALKYDELLDKYYVHQDLKQIYEEYIEVTKNTTFQNISIENALNEKQQKYYIAVPYNDKEEARKMGAQWDNIRKSWYVEPTNIDAIQRWDPYNKHVAIQPTIMPQEEFKNVMEDLGAVFESLPIMDGKPHRIEVIGDKKGQVSGFYVGYLDNGIPAGYFKNNRTGEEIKFASKGYHITKEDKAILLAQAAQKQQERLKQQDELHNKTSNYLTDKIAIMQKAEANQYTENKKINITKGVYKTEHNSLCIPIIDNQGKIWSAQYINDDGTKRIAKNSKKTGCFHPIGGSLDELKKAPAIVIAEGYATAATISEAVGFSAVAAINASNLADVAKSLKEIYPDKPFIIAGDNDAHLLNNPQINKNVGVEYAQQAAKEVNGVAIFPDKENDFNDVVSKSSNDKISQLKNVKLLVDSAVNKCRHQINSLNQDKNKTIERTNSIQK